MFPLHNPNNAEEAAYASYALIDVILERLQLAGVFDDAGWPS
jgi:hypothetical protein